MLPTKDIQNEFLTQYFETLVWINEDKKLTGEQKKTQKVHALSFLSRCWYYVDNEPGQTINQLAHDFALTHSRQGAGFWNGDWPVYGELLTKLSHCYPEEF